MSGYARKLPGGPKYDKIDKIFIWVVCIPLAIWIISKFLGM